MILNSPPKLPLNDYRSRVLTNEKCTEGIYRLRFECPKLARNSRPGQFINVHVTDSYTPLLRRPFSIHRAEAGWIEILFDVRGKGTWLLSQVQPNEFLNILGPLGNTFTIDVNKTNNLFVGGGLGIAPFLFLCQYFQHERITLTGFYGVKTKKQFCCLDDFAALNVPLHFSTEDGSHGFKGFITETLEDYVMSQLDDTDKSVIFACGPPAMLRTIQNLSEKWEIETQVSLETMMACGFGICFGCVVEKRNRKPGEDKYQLVCKNGPIFRGQEVVIPD